MSSSIIFSYSTSLFCGQFRQMVFAASSDGAGTVNSIWMEFSLRIRHLTAKRPSGVR